MDYYHVLGVSRSATKEEIKNAFSKLAVIYQPDKNSQASDPIRDHTTVRFKQVSEAYEVLIDNPRRARYDRDLSSSLSHSSSSSHSSTGKSPGSKVYRYRYEYTYNGNGRPFFIVTGNHLKKLGNRLRKPRNLNMNKGAIAHSLPALSWHHGAPQTI